MEEDSEVSDVCSSIELEVRGRIVDVVGRSEAERASPPPLLLLEAVAAVAVAADPTVPTSEVLLTLICLRFVILSDPDGGAVDGRVLPSLLTLDIVNSFSSTPTAAVAVVVAPSTTLTEGSV